MSFTDALQHLLVDNLARYGPPVLFAAQMFGIFGLPIPDELLMTLAGALIRRGQLGAAATVAAAVAGCSAGITLSYLVGRTAGSAALHRVLKVHEEAFLRTQRWFARFGHWLLTFGYFIPGVRHLTAIAAGSAPISYGDFARAAYPGAMLWCSVFIGIGYWAGDRWEQVSSSLEGHARPVIVAVACAGGLWMLVRFWRRDRQNSL
jgi:membrane protein DedA with SNARE-associated domain